MVAGFFLGPAGIGLTAMQSAVAVGALGTAATGSLGKGFMMGLGAYGGAGLGAGLTSAGAASNTAANATTAGANTGAAATNNLSSSYSGLNKIVPTDAVTSASANTLNPVANSGAFSGYQSSSLAQGPFANTAVNASSSPAIVNSLPAGPASVIPKPSVDVFAGGSSYTPITPVAPPSIVPQPVVSQPIVSAPTAPAASSKFGRFDDVGRGFEKATSSLEGAKEVWDLTPQGTGYGLAATGMGVMQAQQEEAAEKAKAAAAAKGSGYIRPYDYSTEQDPNAYANTSTAESRYFVEPRFIAKDVYKVKDGGLMSLAVGGQVEEMSAANAMGSNTGYPMANLQTPMYANPMMARPVPTNVISPSGDTGVNTYSGEMRMASGGVAYPNTSSSEAKYSYDPSTMKYTQTNVATNPLGGMFGGMSGMGGDFNGGLIKNLLKQMGQSQQSQQPNVGSTSGGIAAPYAPTGIASAADTSMIPNIQLQPQQNVNQKLGLEAFYPMMEQQLAMKGSNLQARGMAEGGTANGGYSLGSYSDGGRLLRGPGDGVSDSIPASIGDHQPARLADGEFVVPARIVSEIGNGSTEAGARKLYAMMDRVQKARRKTVGKDKVAVNTKADKLLPA
jgi:hypothetical protein